LGIAHIPEIKAGEHLILSILLQVFMIYVFSSELYLILHPGQSRSIERMEKKDHVISAILSGTIYFSLYVYVLLVASTQKGLSTQILPFSFSCIAITTK